MNPLLFNIDSLHVNLLLISYPVNLFNIWCMGYFYCFNSSV